jgi:hypothetical protein
MARTSTAGPLLCAASSIGAATRAAFNPLDPPPSMPERYFTFPSGMT